MTTQLLVSVRDSAEAAIALDAGADIIDVKEPNLGSLGFAGSETVQAVVDLVDGRCPVSAALGECTDWLNDEGVWSAVATAPVFPGPLSFVKLGLHGMLASRFKAHDSSSGRHSGPASQPADRLSQSSADMAVALHVESETPKPVEPNPWVAAWQHVRSGISQMNDWHETEFRPSWIAVAYADHSTSQSPAPEAVLAAATGSCRGILIDTCRKDVGNTIDLLSESRLRTLRLAAAEAGLLFALAGRISAEHLPVVARVAPDIVAVRGAVCDHSNRTGAISANRIRSLKTALFDVS